MKLNSVLFFIICLSQTHIGFSQIINFAGTKVFPGESYKSVIDDIDTNKIKIIKEDFSDEYFSAKQIKCYDNSDNIYLGKLHFSNLIGSEPQLQMIEKVWKSSYNGNISPNELIATLFNILDKVGIDHYKDGIWFNEIVEPDKKYKTISLHTHSWHTIELYFDENYYEISEIIRNNEDEYKDFVYIVVYYDDKGLHNFPDSLYTQVFEDKELASRKLRELNIAYIANGEYIRGQIVRKSRDRKSPLKKYLEQIKED